MSATTTPRTTTRRPTATAQDTARAHGADRDEAGTSARAASPSHEPGDFHDLAHLLALPVRDVAHRDRVDRALSLLLGPEGADAPHLVPGRRMPDVVRRRVAGRALSRLSSRDPAHRHLVAGALAILRS